VSVAGSTNGNIRFRRAWRFHLRPGVVEAVASDTAADWSTLEACRYDVMHRRQWPPAERACACDLDFLWLAFVLFLV